MSIYIDCREHYLKEQCQKLSNTNKLFEHIKIHSESLDVADIIIKSLDETECVYIERKTVADLSASIKDGRYREQSLRLSSLPSHNHNIVYIIEGKMTEGLSQLSSGFGGTVLNKQTLYTAMISMLLYKGFSVIRTQSPCDTADFIMLTARKIADSKKSMFYKTPSTTSESGIIDNSKENNEMPTPSYASVIRQKKKDNITTENIGVIMLSQIPSVSSSTAEVIIQKHLSIPRLITDIQNDPECLNTLTITLSNGKSRKISKTACSNIVKFLLCQESTS
jgi:ERCC4-type nuclease